MSKLIGDGFLEAAQDLGAPVRIAAPYLTAGIMRELSPTRVMVDVEAWAGSSPEQLLPSFDAVSRCEWRHLSGLHAKVVLGSRGAIIGSANFTQGGMVSNVELGVRLDDPTETTAWYLSHWKRAVPFQRHELDRYLGLLPLLQGWIGRPAFKALQSKASKPPYAPGAKEESRLVTVLSKFPDEQAARAYLALLSRLYYELQVDPEDPRLSLHVERENGCLFRVNVNNRVALTWYAKRSPFLGFSVEGELGDALVEENPSITCDWEFDPIPRRPRALHLAVNRPEVLLNHSRAWRGVVEWVGRELGYSSRHPGRRIYSPEAGALAMSSTLQNRVLASSFLEARRS